MTDPRPGDAFQPGDVLNNTYRIEALLGRGGTSDVYRARSEISGRFMAIKVLKAEFSGNDDFLYLMKREEEIREIRHDAIVRYAENHRTAEGLVFLVMDYIDGTGLDRRLKEGPMSPDDLLTVCKRVAEGLQATHAQNIVHRDLSPDNILLRNNDPAQAVVIDFGIAKDTKPDAETIVGNEFAGKYAYAAPEQLSGNTDARSDIYSLGALLLANFRGKAPDIGANPMEVVQKKSDPLDTSDVPEPLKSLLDRMTTPDPAARLQSMTEVLEVIQNGAIAEPLSDATVIAPPPKAPVQEPDVVLKEAPAPTPIAKLETAKPPSNAPKKAVQSKSKGGSGGLIAAAVAIVVIGGGAGAYFAGLFGGSGPTYPAVSPFSLTIENTENLPVSASGFVPDPEMQNAMVTRLNEMGGTTDLTLASGEIAQTWGADVLSVMDDLANLEEWQLTMNGNRGEITGTTSDPDILATLSAKYPDTWPGALTGTFDVALASVFLSTDDVDDVLTRFADCGPLTQVSPPVAVGYGPEEPILISGTLASEETRDDLQYDLDDLAEDRVVVIDAEILNDALCLVENYLPQAPNSDIEITFLNGETGAHVSSGRFLMGQNPVIDVILPDDLTTGYLSVFILDVAGSVFHLLPHTGRTDSSVEGLRNGATGPVTIRVADITGAGRPPGTIGFTVDETTLGKSKIMVVHSQGPLFEQRRPTVESAEGYAEALRDLANAGGPVIDSVDSEILTTVQQ
ncbi:MAG: protein kinase [Sulfitobacter sp.]